MARLALLLLLVPALAGARPPSDRARAEAALVQARAHLGPDRFALAAWPADALSGDALGDSGEARVGVQLPAREDACLARKAACWLVLYLPGFDSSAESFQAFEGEVRALDARPEAPPIVVVIPDGRTRLGGGWYVDSRADGRWERFLMQALLPAARDALAPGTPPSRTLVMGHSMGGFGALHLAAAHPGAFAGAAAFNPAAATVELANDALARLEARGAPPDAEALLRAGGTEHFFARILLSMGAAFHPDPRAPHGLAPLFDLARRPWRLDPASEQAFARYDVLRHAARLRAVKVVQLYGGRADPLIPVAQLQALADAANGKPGSGAAPHVTLTVSDGTHLSHLALDLRRALETLVR